MQKNFFDDLDFREDSFDLTRYILTSEIRLNLLLSLYDDSKVLNEIKLDLDKKPGNLLRGLNELIERKLVVKNDKTYSLSSTGYLLSMNILNLFNNLNAVNNHFDFWQRHSINSFTSKFIQRISIWENAELIESNSTDFAKTFNIYSENISESQEINIVLPFFSKTYINVILNSLMGNDGVLNIITNDSILDLIHENDNGNFDSLIGEGKVNIVLTDYDLEFFFTACDNFSALLLFFEHKSFDVSEMLLIKKEEELKNAIILFNSLKEELSKTD